uniref:Activin receptor type-2B n=2 Tax=Lygus hesperus TaxID=30085 RepID=A0A0A9YR21_LYGHE
MRLSAYLPAAFAFLPVVLSLQECYVCLYQRAVRGSSTELEHQFPEESLPSCQRGTLPPPKQCPPRYKGCLTQYSGELVQRACGELNLTICQKANQVEYCYCEGNLCNHKDNELPKTTTEEPDPTSDDEDDDGGSGQGSAFDGGIRRAEPPLKIPKPTHPVTPLDNNQLGKISAGAGHQHRHLFVALLAPLAIHLAF